MPIHTIHCDHIKQDAPRVETQEDVWVIPDTVITKAGVYNRGLRRADDLAKTWVLWEGAPFVHDHPPLDGDEQGMVRDMRRIGGWVTNVRWEDKAGAVVGDVYLGRKPLAGLDVTPENVARNARLVAAVEKGEGLEVSGGYFSTDEIVSGEVDGREYDHIRRFFIPDHVASVAQGACGLKDGCGLGAAQGHEKKGDGRHLADFLGRAVQALTPAGKTSAVLVDEVARGARIEPDEVRAILRGDKCPPPETLDAFASALKLNHSDLVQALQRDGCASSGTDHKEGNPMTGQQTKPKGDCPAGGGQGDGHERPNPAASAAAQDAEKRALQARLDKQQEQIDALLAEKVKRDAENAERIKGKRARLATITGVDEKSLPAMDEAALDFALKREAQYRGVADHTQIGTGGDGNQPEVVDGMAFTPAGLVIVDHDAAFAAYDKAHGYATGKGRGGAA